MEKKIVVTRVFNAPVKLVWKTWTDPELVMRWWGPERFICPSAKIDFREGGRSVVSMRSPKEMGDQEWFSIWDYKKIVPMQSIEFIQNLSDKNGNKMSPTRVGMPPDFPEDIRTVVIFKSLGENKTEMTVTQYADMGQTSKFAKLGLEQSLDKMVELFETI
jgi:uncharacterized protein YndB with AHSA1/START domain